MSHTLHTLQMPLHGVRVVEFEGIGPGPLAARMLADMGAEVITLTRAEQAAAGGAALELAGDERVEGLALNGHPQQRLPNTLHVSFPGVSGRDLLQLKGVARGDSG